MQPITHIHFFDFRPQRSIVPMNVSHFLHWGYDDNTVKITAMTGSAASLLDDANTLHMTACLNKTKITDLDQKKWVGTKMLFIDEVSFMTSTNLDNLDKN